MTNCSIENCTGVVVARGWCRSHYRRWSTYGDPLPGPRAWRKKAAPCIVCSEPCGAIQSRMFCSTRCQSAYYREQRRETGKIVDYACRRCGARGTYEFGSGKHRAYCDPCVEMNKGDRSRDAQARRRAVINGAESERFTSMEIYERDEWTCQGCGDAVDGSLRFPDRLSPSLDHYVPLARGGAHTRANVRLMHLGCNSAKLARVSTGTRFTLIPRPDRDLPSSPN